MIASSHRGEMLMIRRIRLGLMLALLVGALAGCTGLAEEPTATLLPTATMVAPTDTPVSPTETPMPIATEDPALADAATGSKDSMPTVTPTPSWEPVVGAKVVDFTLVDVDGQEHSLSDYLGQPLLLNFFATWCPHCRSEMPTFQQVYEERSAEGFVILAVSVGEDAETVGDFTQENGLTFPILLDTDGVASPIYQVRGIPASLFIDANGVIRGNHVGAITDAEALNSVVDQLFDVE